MIGHLWNNLPKPRMADWSFNRMSVCICLLDVEDKNVVFVEDRKVTISDFSADHAVEKHNLLVKNWWIQYAGDDADVAPVVIARARERLLTGASEWDEQDVVDALHQAYWETFHNEISNRVLLKYGLTSETFLESGKQKLKSDLYNSLCAQIERTKLSLQFILAGFDKNKNPHLWSIDGEREPRCFDELGFWAIGAGAHAALSSLAFHVSQQNLCMYCCTLERLIYFGCEAKFMAESSNLVGKSSFLSIYKYDDTIPDCIFDEELQKLKKKWLQNGAPKPSESVVESIPRMIFSATEAIEHAKQSVSQTAAPKR